MNIFDMYGIKEVANVTFYDAVSGAPVLYLDTLKVSTVEETASNTSANGGWGNSPLIKWDYGKELTLTLEDALFSMKSLAFMQGAAIHRYNSATDKEHEGKRAVQRSKKIIGKKGGTVANELTAQGLREDALLYDESGKKVAAQATDNEPVTGEDAVTVGETYIATWTETQTELETIVVNADSFPGTYKVVGDTYARAYKGGKDEFFQFTIPMAKVNFENTITMQADGDPSTFSMNLTVLRPEDGNMITFTKYPKDAGTDAKDKSIIVDFSK